MCVFKKIKKVKRKSAQDMFGLKLANDQWTNWCKENAMRNEVTSEAQVVVLGSSDDGGEGKWMRSQ